MRRIGLCFAHSAGLEVDDDVTHEPSTYLCSRVWWFYDFAVYNFLYVDLEKQACCAHSAGLDGSET